MKNFLNLRSENKHSSDILMEFQVMIKELGV